MKVKKILMLLVLVALVSSPMVSCSKEKEITFDITKEDMENKSGDVEIKSVELDLGEGGTFVPVYYEGNEVYGLQYLWKGDENSKRAKEYPVKGYFKKNFYKLNSDGVLSETNKEPLSYEYGIVDGGYTYDMWRGDNDDKEIFYVNNKTGEKKKIGDGIFERSKDGRLENSTAHGVIIGNEDFVYIENLEYGSDMKEKVDEVTGVKYNYQDITSNGLEIINIKENKTYKYKGNDKKTFGKFIYSDLTNSFYAIESEGRDIYEMILEGDEVRFDKYDTIKTALPGYSGRLVSLNKNGELVILGGDSNDNMGVIYNLKSKVSKNIKRGNSEFGIIKYFINANKIVLDKYSKESNTGDIYIGEFNKNEQIEIIAKVELLKEEGYESFIIDGEASEDGENMVLLENVVDKNGEIKKVIAHFIKFK